MCFLNLFYLIIIMFINKFRCLKPFKTNIRNFSCTKLITMKISYFSTKDDKFWEDYRRTKSQGGKFMALESQEIQYNKVVHSWEFASRHAISAKEFLKCLRELKPSQESPFIIIDVREDVEFDIYKLPLKNRVNLFNLKLEWC
jgi:hypothetical protein